MASAPGRTPHAAEGTGARLTPVEGVLFSVALPMDEDLKKTLCQQKFDDLTEDVDNFHELYNDLQHTERGGLIGPPVAVQIKASARARHARLPVVKFGQEIEVKVRGSLFPAGIIINRSKRSTTTFLHIFLFIKKRTTVRLSKTKMGTFCKKIRKKIKGPVLKALRHALRPSRTKEEITQFGLRLQY